MKKVCHFTSVHSRYDTRIFTKECCSLVTAGFDVTQIVADGLGNEEKNGVKIIDAGSKQGLSKLKRMTRITKQVFCKCLEVDADIYHFHDPELIPAGLRMKRLGKTVIFDSHEDLPKQLLSKPYLNKPLLWILSKLIGVFEAWTCRQFDAIVTATPFIRDKFLTINPSSIDVNNFPVLSGLASLPIAWKKKQQHVCYAGAIAAIRGIREMVEAMEFVSNDFRLQLGGKFNEKSIEKEVKELPGWTRVDALGLLDRDDVSTLLSKSIAGLVLFHPMPNHVDSQPNKMFEYMSAGIPVIASNFPLWRDIIEKNDCGLCIDPLSPKEISKAIDFLIKNENRAEEMGRNGRLAVFKQFNWSFEEKKLLDLYKRLINKSQL